MNAHKRHAWGATASGIGAAVLLASTLISAPAWAQATPPDATPGGPPPASAPDAPRTVPEQIAPSAQAPQPNAGTALNSPAVIVPKPIDPGIKVPVKTPTNDKMPVIAPPGTPGGDPTTIAK